MEHPSGNSAFEENATHIQTNVDTFKRKPESNDMLHFSKIAKLEVKLDALKSHVTCEISILTEKLDSPFVIFTPNIQNSRPT